jgi:hypothetical protein
MPLLRNVDHQHNNLRSIWEKNCFASNRTRLPVPGALRFIYGTRSPIVPARIQQF